MKTERLKIFFMLKAKEIGKGLIVGGEAIIALFVGVLGLKGLNDFMRFIFRWFPENFPSISKFLGTIFLMFIITIIFGFVYSIIKDWIKRNWKKAGRIMRKKK